MKEYPKVIISEEMIAEAKKLIPGAKINRTIASKIDTITGILGEFVFAQYFFNDWRKNKVGFNKGKIDFENIEIKTSAFPLNENLHLLVRKDYAEKRKPEFYVQVVIDIPSSGVIEINPGIAAYICGYASLNEVDSAPVKDFGSKFGGRGGYMCHYISIKKLKPIEELKEIIQ